MSGKDKDIWFHAMKYGFGWGLPATWQGWVVLLSYLALVMAGVFFIKRFPWLTIPFVIYVFLLSGVLFFMCRKKGEKPESRWGEKL